VTPERLHADLAGPINPKSLGGASYFLLLKDEYSGYKLVKFLKSKTEVLEKIKTVAGEATLATHSRVICLGTDNGSEFRNEATQFYLGAEGIVHELSAPLTQQQNGEAERANRTIIETARSILQASKLPLKLWAGAINAAV